MNVVMYHGSDRAAEVLDAIVGGGKLRNGFHLSPCRKLASNYGREVVAVYLESDLNKAHVGLINKEGNYNNPTHYYFPTIVAELVWDTNIS